MTKETLFVSFSGGRTSAFMSYWLKNNVADKYNLVFVFANTGQEHEKTLSFVNECDRRWGLNVIWIEAVVHHDQRKGCTHKIVNYETAARNGEPFEEVIRKYGIPNKAYPHCTRELKENPIFSLKSALGFSRDHQMAVGIRVDEIDRIGVKAKQHGCVHPLISLVPTTKQKVLEWWAKQPFDLGLSEHLGNCVTCWKKSDRKLMTIALDNPESFIFCDTMERELGTAGANEDRRVFFRGKESAREVVGKSRLVKFTPFFDGFSGNAEIDASNGCSESCDAFAS